MMLLLHAGLGSLAVEKNNKNRISGGNQSLKFPWWCIVSCVKFAGFSFLSLLSSIWCDSSGESLWVGRNAPSFLYRSHHEWSRVRRNVCSLFHDLCSCQCVFLLFDPSWLLCWIVLFCYSVPVAVFRPVFFNTFYWHCMSWPFWIMSF